MNPSSWPTRQEPSALRWCAALGQGCVLAPVSKVSKPPADVPLEPAGRRNRLPVTISYAGSSVCPSPPFDKRLDDDRALPRGLLPGRWRLKIVRDHHANRPRPGESGCWMRECQRFAALRRANPNSPLASRAYALPYLNEAERELRSLSRQPSIRGRTKALGSLETARRAVESYRSSSRKASA